jgi:Lon protease-like protein
MGELAERFPLFPLGIVLLPSEVIPLHIFEERYKQMIAECIDGAGEFGIVWLSDDGLKEIGCSAAVTEVLERMPDGRMNILVRGTRPFRLLKKVGDLAYPAGDIEFLDDADPAGEPEPAAEPDAAADARERYADLVERVTDSRPSTPDLAGLDAYAMAATIEFALDAKQALLELRDEDERMRMIGELFRATMQRLDYAERAAEVARANGKVRIV